MRRTSTHLRDRRTEQLQHQVLSSLFKVLAVRARLTAARAELIEASEGCLAIASSPAFQMLSLIDETAWGRCRLDFLDVVQVLAIHRLLLYSLSCEASLEKTGLQVSVELRCQLCCFRRGEGLRRRQTSRASKENSSSSGFMRRIVRRREVRGCWMVNLEVEGVSQWPL